MQATRGTTLTRPAGPDRRLVWALLAVTGTVIDQVTKTIALATLDPQRPVPLLGGLLTLQLTWNDGAAFSLGGGGSFTWVFTTFSTVMLVAVTWFAFARLHHRGWAVVLGVLTAGICGNLIDRLFRPPSFAMGHVVDFLQLPRWPIFNVADMCVCFAAAGLVWLAVIKNVPPGRPVPEESTGSAHDADAAESDPDPTESALTEPAPTESSRAGHDEPAATERVAGDRDPRG